MKKQHKTIKVTSPQGNDVLPAVVEIKFQPTPGQSRQPAFEISPARRGKRQPLNAWFQAGSKLKAGFDAGHPGRLSSGSTEGILPCHTT